MGKPWVFGLQGQQRRASADRAVNISSLIRGENGSWVRYNLKYIEGFQTVGCSANCGRLAGGRSELADLFPRCVDWQRGQRSGHLGLGRAMP